MCGVMKEWMQETSGILFMRKLWLLILIVLAAAIGLGWYLTPKTFAQTVIFTPICVGNVTTDTAAFQAIVTAAAGTPRTIKVPFKADPLKRCILNMTIPVNISLDFTDGGAISLNSGTTLTLQSGKIIAAPTQRIFYALNTNTGSAGTGKVSFTKEAPSISVMWFGATGDGTTDDIVPIEAARDSMDMEISGENPLIYRRGTILDFPVPSVYYSLSRTLNIYRPAHVRGVGTNAGSNATPNVRLVWSTATVGIRFHRYNTTTVVGAQSDGAIISGLQLVGTFATGGTATVAGTADVSGLTITRVSGPSFADDFNAGYNLSIDGYNYVVETRASANSLTVYKPRLVVSATNGSPTVNTASGFVSDWPTGKWDGQAIKIDGVTYTISTHTASAITLTANYTGATTSSVDAQVQTLATATGVPTIVNKLHGIDVYSQIEMYDLAIRNFSGNNINIDTSTVPACCPLATDTNANNSRISRVLSSNSKGHGILVKGTNSNNLSIENFNATNNRGAGIMEVSFLGNVWTAAHLAENSFAPIFSNAVSNAFSCLSCYTEGGQPTSVGSQFSLVVGGTHGAGWTKPNMGYVTGQNRMLVLGSGYTEITPLVQIRGIGDDDGTSPSIATSFRMGESIALHSTFWSVGASNDTASTSGGFTAANPGPAYRFSYCRAGTALGTGHFTFGYNDPTCADATKQVIAMSGDAALEGAGQLWFPNNIKYIGSAKDVGLQRTATNTLTVTDGAAGTGTLLANVGTFTTLNSSGGALNGTIGATTPSTGAFTFATAEPTGGSTGEFRMREIAANGTNYVGFKAPALVTADKVWELPNGDGTNGQILQTNGAGVLSWSANSATGMANPMTTIGDVIYSSTTAAPGSPARLAIGTAGQCLVVTAGLPAWGSCAAGATAAGSDTQVQFNNAGAFGADAAFTWNNTSKEATMTAAVVGGRTPLRLANTNNGNTSTVSMHIGNDAATDTFAFKLNSSTFTGDGNLASVTNRQNAPLAFGTNNLERARINAAGLLGLGTAAPLYKFHILGANANPSLSAVSGIVAIDGGSNSNELAIGTYSASPFGVWLQAKDNASSGLGSGAAYPLVLNPLGGNVGIGTTSFGTSAAKVLAIGDGTAPTTIPSGVSQIWSQNVTSSITPSTGSQLKIQAKGFQVFPHMALGSLGEVDYPVGANGPTILSIRDEFNDFTAIAGTANNKWSGIQNYITSASSVALAANSDFYVSRSLGQVSGAANHLGRFYGATGELLYGGTGGSMASGRGLYGECQHFGGTISLCSGVEAKFITTSSAGTIDKARGMLASILNEANVPITGSARVGQSIFTNGSTATVAEANGYHIATPINSGGGTVPKWASFQIDDPTGVTGLGATYNYNIWSRGTNSLNLFEGIVRGSIQDLGVKGQVFNVKAYGAVGNGSTNDYATFALANTAAVAAGGGTIFVPPGTYIIGSRLFLSANVSMAGAGIGVSILKAQNSAALAELVNSDDNARIEDLTLDGNRANSGATSAIQTNGDHTRLNRVELKNATNGLVILNATTDLRVSNSWLHDNAAGALCPGGTPATDVSFTDSLIADNDGGGLGLNVNYLHLSGNTIRDNDNTGGQIVGSGTTGIYRNWTIINNSFIIGANPNSTTHIEWTDLGATITGNTFTGGMGALTIEPITTTDAGDVVFANNTIDSLYGVTSIDTASSGRARNVVVQGNFATANVDEGVTIRAQSTATWTVTGNDFHLATTPYTDVNGNSATVSNNRGMGLLSGEGTAIGATTATIAPTHSIHRISAVADPHTISTITLPVGFTNGGTLQLVPNGDNILLSTSGGNIGRNATLVSGKTMILVYLASTAKWYPSY